MSNLSQEERAKLAIGFAQNFRDGRQSMDEIVKACARADVGISHYEFAEAVNEVCPWRYSEIW